MYHYTVKSLMLEILMMVTLAFLLTVSLPASAVNNKTYILSGLSNISRQ